MKYNKQQMKNFRNFIKGIVLTGILILVFSFNFSGNHSERSVASDERSAIAMVTENFVPQAYAQVKPAAKPVTTTPKNKPKQVDTLPESLVKMIAKASTLINKIFNPVIYFLTKYIGGLLANDYVYGGSMGKMLQSIWVVSRNIVNIVFVLILLFLALRHIFSGDENSDLKKVLPTFVLMLIAINFSWLGTKLVLDAANVATNVAFAIPSGVKGVQTSVLDVKKCKEDKNDPSGIKGSCMPTGVYMPFDSIAHRNYTEATCQKLGLDKKYKQAYPDNKKKAGKSIKNISKTSVFCWNTLQIDKFSRSNAAYYLTYGMAKVQNLPLAQGGKSIAKVGIGTLLALLIQLVYIIAFGSLFIALIIRVAMLWILVAFSPFTVLLYYLSSTFQVQGGEAAEYLSFKTLFDWAFVPTKVAAVWAIGFIMITTGQTATDQLFVNLDKKGAITSKVFSVNSLFMNMDNLKEFIWLIMTIGIIWVGTFAVLTKIKVGDRLFQSINTYGTSLAKEIASSPRWAPIIPMLDTNTGNLKMRSYAQVGINPLKDIRTLKEKYTNMPINKFKNLETKFKNNPAIVREIQTARSDADKFKAFQKHTGFSTQFIKDSRNKSHIENMMAGAHFKEPKALLAKIIAGAGVAGSMPTPQTQATVKLDSKTVKDAVVAALKKTQINGRDISDAQLNAGRRAALVAYKADPSKVLAHYINIAKAAAKKHQTNATTSSTTTGGTSTTASGTSAGS